MLAWESLCLHRVSTGRVAALGEILSLGKGACRGSSGSQSLWFPRTLRKPVFCRPHKVHYGRITGDWTCTSSVVQYQSPAHRMLAGQEKQTSLAQISFRESGNMLMPPLSQRPPGWFRSGPLKRCWCILMRLCTPCLFQRRKLPCKGSFHSVLGFTL